jgi:hypothetical protein
MTDLENRLVERMCGLLADLIQARSEDGTDTQTFNDLEGQLLDLGELAGTQLLRTFMGEALLRIREVNPKAGARILEDLSGRLVLGDGGGIFDTGETEKPMRDFNLKARFIDHWCHVFAWLLDAQLKGPAPAEIKKLRSRYDSLAQIATDEVTQEFFHEAVSRVSSVAPDAAAGLLKGLLAKGIIKDQTFTMGEA